MNDPQDPAFGVKAFSIMGRMRSERERLKGMTDMERQWRAQWLKDQVLSPDEPKFVPEHYKATTNIFRRLYKDPLLAFQRMLEPTLGHQGAYYARHTLGKSLMFLYAGWVCVYVYKYFSNDFTRAKSISIWVVHKRLYPDDPDYPNIPKLSDRDYYDQGFYSSPLRVDIKYVPPPPPPPPGPRFREDGTDWTRAKSLDIVFRRPRLFPDDPDYPNFPKIDKFYDQGFSSSPFGQPEKKK